MARRRRGRRCCRARLLWPWLDLDDDDDDDFGVAGLESFGGGESLAGTDSLAVRSDSLAGGGNLFAHI